MRKENFSENSPGRLVKILGGALAFVPEPLPGNAEQFLDVGVMTALAGARGALGELVGIGRILPNPYLLIRPFMRKEAEASSRIEGTEVGLDELFVYEADPGRSRERTDLRQEVVNYVRALEWGLKRREELPIGLRFVRELHEILMTGVRGRDKAPGEFRKGQNHIGGSSVHDAIYVPPPAPEMMNCISDWEKYLRADSGLPPLIRLAMIHYQFEVIHPFLDGNGRVGRLLIPIFLCEWGLLSRPLLYLSAFFERNRREYFELLQSVTEKGTWREWILFFLAAVEAQSKDASFRAKMLLDKSEEHQQLVRSRKGAPTAVCLAGELIGSPAFSASQVAKSLGVTLATALRAINHLEKLGIVKEITGKERNRIWMAPAIFDILRREFVLAEDDE